MLFTQPPVFALSLYIAVVYGILYLMFSTFTFVFSQQYGFGTAIIGLAYIPTRVGMLFGTITFGTITDIIIKKRQAKGEATAPEDRIPIWLTLPNGIIIMASLFWYGWATEDNTPWIVPMIGVAFFCFGLMGVMVCIMSTLVLGQPLMIRADVSPDLPSRCIHFICRIRGGRHHSTPIYCWRSAAAGGIIYVRRPWARLGEQCIGIPCPGDGAGAYNLPVVWGQDTCQMPRQSLRAKSLSELRLDGMVSRAVKEDAESESPPASCDRSVPIFGKEECVYRLYM
jgi:hypothetical protein